MTIPNEKAMLHIIGGVNIDLIMGSLADWPRWGVEVILPDSECRVGGAAGNVALALMARGVEHRIVANIGSDPFARTMADAFPGSAATWPVHAGPSTLSVGVCRSDGERTFLTTLGHMAVFDLDDALTQLEPTAKPGDIALLCGTYLTPRLTARYGELLAWLRNRGVAVALDSGWPDGGWSDTVRAEALGWLPFCRHVLLNEIETLGLAGTNDLDAAAAALRPHLANDAVLVVKRGGNGVSAWSGGQRLDVTAPAVTVIDTIGAGDIFNAGYLEGQRDGLPLAECLRLGTETASLAVSTAPRRYR